MVSLANEPLPIRNFKNINFNLKGHLETLFRVNIHRFRKAKKTMCIKWLIWPSLEPETESCFTYFS